MINLSFAPNENWSSAFQALGILMNPSHYFSTKPIDSVQSTLAEITLTSANQIFLLLSARSALYLYLDSLEFPAGSEVIVQAFTCEAVVLPVLQAGYTPIYCDIERSSLSTDLESVQKVLSKKTKVLILQHSFGMTPQFRNDILELCARRNVLVIEDLAHGFHLDIFSSDTIQKTVKLFSFGRSKLLSSTHGGAIVIPERNQSDQFAKKYALLKFPSRKFIARSLFYKIFSPLIRTTFPIYLGKIMHRGVLATHLFTTEISNKEKAGHYDNWLEKKYPGALARFIQTELLQVKVTIAQNVEVAGIYQTSLDSQKRYASLPVLRYPYFVEKPEILIQKMKRKNIYLGDWYTQVIAPKQINLIKMKYQAGSCPTAEEVCQHVINLPLRISQSEASEVITQLRKSYV